MIEIAKNSETGEDPVTFLGVRLIHFFLEPNFYIFPNLFLFKAIAEDAVEVALKNVPFF